MIICLKVKTLLIFSFKNYIYVFNFVVIDILCNLCELWSPTNSRVIPFTCRAIATAAIYVKDKINTTQNKKTTADWIERPISCILLELYNILFHFKENVRHYIKLQKNTKYLFII